MFIDRLAICGFIAPEERNLCNRGLISLLWSLDRFWAV